MIKLLPEAVTLAMVVRIVISSEILVLSDTFITREPTDSFTRCGSCPILTTATTFYEYIVNV